MEGGNGTRLITSLTEDRTPDDGVCIWGRGGGGGGTGTRIASLVEDTTPDKTRRGGGHWDTSHSLTCRTERQMTGGEG